MNPILIAGNPEAGAGYHTQLLKAGYDITFEADAEAIQRLTQHQNWAAIIVPPYPYCRHASGILRRLATYADGISTVWINGGSTSEAAVSSESRAKVYQILPVSTAPEEIVEVVRRATERSALLLERSYLQSRLLLTQLGMDRAREVRSALCHSIDGGNSTPFAINGFDIGSFERPAEGTGGDFLGWFSLPDDRLVVYLGDAAGHDHAATAIRDYVTHELALLYARSEWGILGDPAVILSHLNSLIYPAKRVHASFLYLVINQNSHRVFWASAGQTPFIARTAKNVINLYFSNSTILGIEPEPLYETREIFLDHYTHLTLYSDGLLNSRDHFCDGGNHTFTVEGLKAFHKYAPDDPRLFAKMIYRHYLQVSENEVLQSDDISILCIRTGIPYVVEPLNDTLPPIPAPSDKLINDILGLSGQVGAEVGYDPESKTYYVAIHGRADLHIAVAVVSSVKQAIRSGVQRLVLDCLDTTAIDSCFMGTLQDLYNLCQAFGTELCICIAHRELIDTMLEHHLNGLVNRASPHRWKWDKELDPIVRKQRLDTREDVQYLIHSHKVLASLNPGRYDHVVPLLEEDAKRFDEKPDDEKTTADGQDA